MHHDVWDYDVPAQPGLYSVWRDSELHDVVAQVTKTGFVFVLDRTTGVPFLPIEERPVNQAGAPGEVLSPTQPFPAATPPVVPSRLSPDDAFGITWFDRRACRRRIAGARSAGLFTPPSEQGTLLYPFTGGGANWGGAAFDPARNLLVVNMSSVAHHVQLIPADQVDAMRQVFPDEEVSTQAGAPFGMKRELLLSPLGIPCTPPPWGVLAGVDLARGEIVWRKTLGEIGVKLGTPNLGGPIVTAGGLVLILCERLTSRPARSAGRGTCRVLARAALEAVRLAGRVGLDRRRLAQQPAQVDEVLLRGRALLQLRGPPLGDELVRRHAAALARGCRDRTQAGIMPPLVRRHGKLTPERQ